MKQFNGFRSSQVALALFTLTLAATIAVSPISVQAAKKYYPPGFTPPADETAAPAAIPAPAPVIIQQPGQPQVIIKTVPVQKVIVKPKDPMTVLLEEQRYYEALRLIEKRLKQSPNNMNLQLLRAQILREEGNFDDALKAYQAIYDKSAKSGYYRSLALNGMAWTDYSHGLYAQSIGDAFGAEAYMKKAHDRFQQALKLNPKLTYAWTGLGQWYLSQDKIKDAEAAIRKAMRLAPSDTSVQLAQSQLLLAQNKASEALPILFGVKAKNSHNPQVYLLLGKASLETNRVDDAIIHLKQLLGMVPDHAEALRLLSQSYERKMEPEQAEEALQKAISLSPSDVSAVENLLKIYDERGEKERSILTLKTLLKNLPTQQRYQAELMKRLAAANRWDEAYEQGLTFSGQWFNVQDPDKAQLDTLMNLFIKSVYHHGKGTLDRKALLENPVIQKARNYTLARLQNNPDNLDYRLNLLLLDPLIEMPNLPVDYAYSNTQLPQAIMIAFLKGEWEKHNDLLNHWMAERAAGGKSLPMEKVLETADELLLMGDYLASEQLVKQLLAEKPGYEPALALQGKIETTRREAQDQLKSLAMLPKRIPETYWEKTASEALRLSGGNWRVHALLAEQLAKRNQLAMALRHQKLAARYAPTAREKTSWEKKAAATERLLKRKQSSSSK